MKVGNSPAERFLKKYYNLDSFIQFEDFLLTVPVNNYAALRPETVKVDCTWELDGVKTKLSEVLSISDPIKKKHLVDWFLKNSLKLINEASAATKEIGGTKAMFDQFSAAHYSAGGLAGSVRQRDKRTKDNFRLIVDTLINQEQQTEKGKKN